MKSVRAVVTGRVQGVWFRAHTRDRARELGVRGFVRNLSSGDVELVAVGEDVSVDALVQWVHQGPPMAVVHGVVVEPLESDEEYRDFQVRY